MNIPSVKKIVFGGTKVPNSICERMNALESVLIGNSVTSIGDRAFIRCSSLTSVEIGDSVTSIGSLAFCHCSSLTSVEIPDSVTSIGNSAFSGCSSLKSVRYAGTKAEWEAIEKGSSLFDWSCVMEIVCSDGTVSRY
ncbi:MAG: leucine-rich repeat domain-containing protein [Clostridia bacterium]|nr:leucine-rich repeat domain-containing protein [Clostridia bacterium]